jgi:hypothetical protein
VWAEIGKQARSETMSHCGLLVIHVSEEGEVEDQTWVSVGEVLTSEITQEVGIVDSRGNKRQEGVKEWKWANFREAEVKPGTKYRFRNLFCPARATPSYLTQTLVRAGLESPLLIKKGPSFKLLGQVTALSRCSLRRWVTGEGS